MGVLGGDWEKDSGQDQSPGLEGCVCISTGGFAISNRSGPG